MQCRACKGVDGLCWVSLRSKQPTRRMGRASNMVGVTLAWRVMKSTPYDQTDISPTYPTALLKTDS